MRLMVACTVLTWIEVDTDAETVGPAHVHNLPENLTFPEDTDVHSVLAIDPEHDSTLSVHSAAKAIRLVKDHMGPLGFVLEET